MAVNDLTESNALREQAQWPAAGLNAVYPPVLRNHLLLARESPCEVGQFLSLLCEIKRPVERWTENRQEWQAPVGRPHGKGSDLEPLRPRRIPA